MPRTTEAQYPGRCAACDEDFEAGDDIFYSDEDEGWVPIEHDLCLPNSYYDEEVKEESGW